MQGDVCDGCAANAHMTMWEMHALRVGHTAVLAMHVLCDRYTANEQATVI